MSISETVIQALADMRKGRRVLVVTLTAPGAEVLHGQVRALLVNGEKAQRSSGALSVSRYGGGWIQFMPIVSARAGCRGMCIDTVIVDHSELREALAPAQSVSLNPTFVCR